MQLKEQSIRIDEYNYTLPEEQIASYPLSRRDSSKLLYYNNGNISQDSFSHLSEFIPSGSTLVFNNTKVIPARILFEKSTGASIEVFCLAPSVPLGYGEALETSGVCVWQCLIGNLKKWKTGRLQKEITLEGTKITLFASLIQSHTESHEVEFRWDNTRFTFAEILSVAGQLPIPPYLKRQNEDSDKETYQTIYSKIDGSVAAPTAGLHFTPEVLQSLISNKCLLEEVTLHVGAGTFKPVKSLYIGEHKMHSEAVVVTQQTIQQLLHSSNSITAVGTTSVRTLESLYHIGEIIEKNPTVSIPSVSQWQAYATEANRISKHRALKNILQWMEQHKQTSISFDTQIIIVPGYRFQMVDALITNFHQPRSTLLLLVSAFIGEDWKRVYKYALENQFRFLSYGDSSLLVRNNSIS